MPTTSMPVYLNQVGSSSPGSTQGTMPVKASTAALMMMMDQSLASGGIAEDPMDSSDFMFCDDEDLSSSDSDDDDDDDSEEDSEEDSDEDSSDDDDDSDVSLQHEDENAMAVDVQASMNQMRTGLQRVRSASSLKSMLGTSSMGDSRKSNRRRRDRNGGGEMPTMILAGGGGPLRRGVQGSSSMANLLQMKMAVEKAQEAERKKIKHSISFNGNMVTSIMQAPQEEKYDESIPKPDDYLATLIGGTPERFSYDSLEGFFLPVKPEYVSAWTNELTRAIRNHDLDALKEMHQQGHRMQACNQFGETVVHLAVRRGTPEMLRFLLTEAGVSMRVCCDYGRTPLHDAAWSLAASTGTLEKMELLLGESPMQLYILDKRGFTPLSYVPRNRWKECNEFLDRQYAKGRLFRIGSK